MKASGQWQRSFHQIFGCPDVSHYETDIVAWSEEQAALLRAGRFSEIDIPNIAGEIEDVGKSEKHELASRMTVLLANLLK